MIDATSVISDASSLSLASMIWSSSSVSPARAIARSSLM